MQTLSIIIKRWYTDTSGIIVDKSLVPSVMQKPMPFWLMNIFDKNGSYLIQSTIKRPYAGVYYLYTETIGSYLNFLNFQADSDIKKELKLGDVVHVFADDPTLPNYFCFIQLHSDDVAYNSFLSNMIGKAYHVTQMQYLTDNNNNWNQCINVTSENDFGLYSDRQILPLNYRDPYNYQDDILIMKMDENLTDKTGLSSFMLFETNFIQLNFEFDYVISLTPNIDSNGNTDIRKAKLFQIG